MKIIRTEGHFAPTPCVCGSCNGSDSTGSRSWHPSSFVPLLLPGRIARVPEAALRIMGVCLPNTLVCELIGSAAETDETRALRTGTTRLGRSARAMHGQRAVNRTGGKTYDPVVLPLWYTERNDSSAAHFSTRRNGTISRAKGKLTFSRYRHRHPSINDEE